MANWAGRVHAITLVAEVLERAKEFYGRAFELPVHFEDEHSAVCKVGTCW